MQSNFTKKDPRNHKQKVQAAFDRAAPHYDQVAVLQQEVGGRLLERLQYIHIDPGTVLDIGCGTGRITHSLSKHYKYAEVIALDLSQGMLRHYRKHYQRWWRKPLAVCADAESLPFKDNSVDLIFSSLTLQWCEDLDAVFKECARVLKPGGLFMFASLGPDTLTELRQSWASVDKTTHVNTFLDMHDVGDALVRARFADPVMDVDHIVMTYADVTSILKELKLLGGNTVSGAADRWTGKRKFAAMQMAYEEFRQDGILPSTYEIVYGHAWAADLIKLRKQAPAGEVRVPIENIGRGNREKDKKKAKFWFQR